MTDKGEIIDTLISKYRGIEVRPLPPVTRFFDVIYTYGLKVGEFLMLTDFNRLSYLEGSDIVFDCHKDNERKNVLVDFLDEYYREPINNARWVSCHKIVEEYDCGNGNMLQQLYRACGFPVDVKPRGNLEKFRSTRKKGRIGLHLHGYTADKTQVRAMSPETKLEVEQFIKLNPQYEFVEFGTMRQFEDTIDFTNVDLYKTVAAISTCEFFICINSSFMHAAAAFDCKLITLISTPIIERCYFPILKNNNPLLTPRYYDTYWLYPQSVHLHERGENELVKPVSCYNIERAVNGEIYPFWDDEYLELINDV